MKARLSARMLLLVAVTTTIGCDRVTKHAATLMLADAPGRSYLADTLRLEYTENPGGFLGLGGELPPLVRTLVLTVGTGVMLLTLAWFAVRYRLRGWTLIGAGLFLAGGASNWIDRLIRGSVVDFLNVGIGPVRTGIFNVADVAIMAGAILVACGEWRAREPRADAPVGEPS